MKEVKFDVFCPKCRHEEKLDIDDPCYDCLDIQAREDSCWPVHFEEKEKNERGGKA